MCAEASIRLCAHLMNKGRNNEDGMNRQGISSGSDRGTARKGRVILHIDMNAFYCSVHAAEEPWKYRNKPCAVSGSVEQRKGIIVTSSYEARKRGVRTGMQVREALKLCPELILIRPDFELYRSYSRRFMSICSEYTPLVEAMSIDECYLDITGSGQFGTPVEIARQIQNRIFEQLHLPCSIGIAPNKLLAKMASDMKKPNGLTILRKRDVPKLLWPKPCSALYGIGAKTADKLKQLSIHTIGELARADEERLVRHFGVHGRYMKRAANGEDDAEVKMNREPNKSIGHMTTLPRDYTEDDDIRRVFLALSDQVTRRLRKHGMLSSTVQITIRTPAMKTITRSAALSAPSADPDVFYKEAVRLFEKHWVKGKPVRLLGLTAQNLQPKEQAAVQLDLFEYQDAVKKDRLQDALDAIRDKFGEDAVFKAGLAGDEPSKLLRDQKRRGTSLQMDWLKLQKMEQKMKGE